MKAALESLVEAATPQGAEVDMSFSANDPAFFDPDSQALQLGREALERASGMEVALTRSGGSIPILALFATRNIPTILSGFALADDAIHAPDESFRVASLELGERAAHELYGALARL
jgi:acetylornithine deacetylase/succinyl-diaminopimelate desuccinylase-like protein